MARRLPPLTNPTIGDALNAAVVSQARYTGARARALAEGQLRDGWRVARSTSILATIERSFGLQLLSVTAQKVAGAGVESPARSHPRGCAAAAMDGSADVL